MVRESVVPCFRDAKLRPRNDTQPPSLANSPFDRVDRTKGGESTTHRRKVAEVCTV